MIAIKWSDYQKYGCPKCGCNSARSGNVSGRGTAFGTCRECKENFVVLSDEITRSAFGYCTGKKDSQGKDIFEYPKVQEHPRNGIPFKFQGSEFDLERLDKLATENSNILTKEILTECKI